MELNELIAEFVEEGLKQMAQQFGLAAMLRVNAAGGGPQPQRMPMPLSTIPRRTDVGQTNVRLLAGRLKTRRE